MLENIRLSFQGLWSHKMRSFLTMLGIIIGIAAIIAIVSTIKGTNEQIKENLIGSGDNTVNVQFYQGEDPYEMEWNGIPDGVPVISEDTKKKLEELKHVEGASLYTMRDTSGAVYYKNTGLSGGRIYGIDSDYLGICNYIVKQGRGFTKSDYENFRKVVVLDESSAEILFQGEDAIGKTLEIKQEPYVVIGIIAKSSKFEPVINTMEEYETYMAGNIGAIYVPDTTWSILYNYDEPQAVVLKLDKVDNMTVAGKSAEEILNARISVQDDTMKYKAADLLKQAEDIQKLGQSTNTMLIWIAGISLLVGGIGVMNIMLVSVTERTREIGIRKSLGARTKSILLQFLAEAGIITLIGGLIGIVLGALGASAVCSAMGFAAQINASTVVIAAAFSSAVGIFFGIYPAKKAAKLSPIEALRHE